MFSYANLAFHKLRVFLVGALLIITSALLLVFLVSAIDTTRTQAISPNSADDTASVSESDNPNVVAGGIATMADDTKQAMSTVGLAASGGIQSVAAVTTQSGKFVAHSGSVMVHGTGSILLSSARSEANIMLFALRVPGKAASLVSYATDVRSVIQPIDHTPTPTITQLRIQQAAIIQSGTQDAPIATMTVGVGGACDSGNGNGGYPMSWCNAPMDSIPTVSYSSDLINRECTSYAYWYFTSIERQTDFHVTGNAKYWATTSNYPTQTTPAIGAIAVETAGYYGHVAIVQALPGQNYGGQVVPAGYVLISEMNYDWNGHFRYSYSPLGKFSAYIYP